MRTCPGPTKRPAFTLLEMMLATAIAVLLLAALYAAVDLQLRHTEAARDVVEQTTLARTLLNRMSNDIAPSLTTPEPTRYQPSRQSGSGNTGTPGTGSGTGTGTQPPAGTTPPTGT